MHMGEKLNYMRCFARSDISTLLNLFWLCARKICSPSNNAIRLQIKGNVMPINYVLVTGGAGFIGSNLLKKLRKSFNVVSIDNFDKQIHGPNADRVKSDGVVNFDISKDDFTKLEKLGTPTAVIHLAAQTGTTQSMYELENYYQTNITGTARLLDFTLKHQQSIKHFLFASSRAVYGEGSYRCKKCDSTFNGKRRIENLEIGDFSVHCPVCHKIAIANATKEASQVSPASHYALTNSAMKIY